MTTTTPTITTPALPRGIVAIAGVSAVLSVVAVAQTLDVDQSTVADRDGASVLTDAPADMTGLGAALTVAVPTTPNTNDMTGLGAALTVAVPTD